MGMQTFYGKGSPLLLWVDWWQARGKLTQWYIQGVPGGM